MAKFTNGWLFEQKLVTKNYCKTLWECKYQSDMLNRYGFPEYGPIKIELIDCYYSGDEHDLITESRIVALAQNKKEYKKIRKAIKSYVKYNNKWNQGKAPKKDYKLWRRRLAIGGVVESAANKGAGRIAWK